MQPQTKTANTNASIARAYLSANQAGFVPLIAARVNFDAISFDLLDEFDEVTNHRFQPKRAGYYYIRGQIAFVTMPVTLIEARLVLNGVTTLARGILQIANINEHYCATAAFEYLTPNDFVELYAMYNGVMGANSVRGTSISTQFFAFRVS